MGDWFDSWCQRHATIFGLTTVENAAMLSSWRQLFEACVYTPDELNDATDWLAKNAPPKWPGDHLGAIQGRIKSLRAIGYRRHNDDVERDRGVCTRCQGSGRIVVPHLRGIEDGEWRPVAVARGGATYYTMAVTCSCPLGQWFNDRQNVERRLMTLGEYERRNPRWKIQQYKRQQEQLAEAALCPPTKETAAIVGRLARQFGLQGDAWEGNR